MKKIIDGKRYDTDTATMLCMKGTGTTANFSDWYEKLYVTRRGNFFVNFWGGANTRFAEHFNNGRSRSEGSGIRVITEAEAISFINNECFDMNEEAIQKYLDIEDA
jgi:hypothetical protein